jgi:signal transduction histidine kinase/CheY-like chemotaxis protein/HPt (histidine-containing phosphotransfer) domain-containing protein
LPGPTARPRTWRWWRAGWTRIGAALAAGALAGVALAAVLAVGLVSGHGFNGPVPAASLPEPAWWILGALCVAVVLLAAALGVQMRRWQQRRDELEAMTHRLQHAHDRAEQASLAKTRFLARISHEVRTPLQGLLGMLALLRDQPAGPRQVEHLRAASDSAEHLLTLLDDLLDLSLAESGRLPVRPAPLATRQLLLQIEALMRPLAAAKGLALHIDTEPSVPEWIVGDALRLKQVLVNLLSNAVKFSDRGSVSLDVRVHRPVGPGRAGSLAFLVTDTGIGIDRPTAVSLFAPRAPDASRASPDSHGLGLEISGQLAGAMGGRLEVRSVPGEGSRFRLELPCVPADPPGSSADAIGAAQGGTARWPGAPDLRPLRVLVAEDHPVNRQYLASLLEALGHAAHFVADGRAAVQAMAQPASTPFDLVLMDLHMPELDGVAATRAIRALPDRAAATVPIVALTADVYPATRDRCVVAGMNDFLSKPVRPQDLWAALRRLFGQEAAAVAEEPATALEHLPAEGFQDLGQTELVDRAALSAALRGIPAARMSQLVHGFLDGAPQTVAGLRTAVRDGDPLELRRHAHAARGAALNLGLRALADTAQALHDGAAHLPAHEVAHLVQRFDELLPRTRAAAQAAGLARP